MPSQKYDCPVIKLNQPDDSYKIQPLPAPSGAYPYRLQLSDIVSVPNDKLSFHMVGDTGGVRAPQGQKKIAAHMGVQIAESNADDKASFLYHLGDVVYHFGEAEHYDRQFFEPYGNYPCPVFAIAGNHDSDINPDNPVPYHSLDAFKAVFCDTEQRDVSFSKSKKRKSMVQPNIYWTLQTPLANIIGLHSNVPKYGYVSEEQRQWFIKELINANKERPGKAILVCIHHSPYTADVNHGSSIDMIAMLESAFAESGVRPDAIFSGHVHNYQRFHKTYSDGKVLPFIVSGAGGFDEIHAIVEVGDTDYSPAHPLFDNVHLENYCDNCYGFLRVGLERTKTGITLSGTYYSLNTESDSIKACDSFRYEV